MTSGAARRVALVTGATGAIGEAIAEGLARQPGTAVVITARDEAKARRTVTRLRERTGSPEIRYEMVDLGRRASIRALAERWQGPLHVLVNDAATTPRRRRETPEGLEVQFATNVMGYFWMMEAFRDALAASAPSRVVNVASYWAGGLDTDDLQFERRAYDNDDAYRQSKQADRMLSAAFAERFRSLGIAINACHPGDVPSQLARDLGFGGHETPAQGADTPLWLATSDVGQAETGLYYEHRRRKACRFSANREAVERLYAACFAVGAGEAG